MMAIERVTTFIDSFSQGYDPISQLLLKLPIDWTIVDQTLKQTDLGGDVQKAFGHFVATGQIWALLTGLIVGYLFRSLTSY